MIFRLFSKISAALFISICIPPSVFSQAELPDLYRDYFKINERSAKLKEAKVQSVLTIYSKDGISDTTGFAVYDQSGNILKNVSKKDTSAQQKGEFVYTNISYVYKEGRLTEKIDSSSKDIKKHTLDYDDMGNITGEQIKINNSKVFEIDYEYDDLARLIESSAKDVIRKCTITETYAYDSYNNLAKKTLKNECSAVKEKPLTLTYSYNYDNKYRIIEKQVIYPNAGFKMINYIYGKNGELISVSETEGADTRENIKYKYEDSSMVKIEKTETIGDIVKTITGIAMNDKSGNLLEEKYYDSNGKLLFEIKNIYQYY